MQRIDVQAALDLLWADLMSLYHEAQVVTIVGKDGIERPYRPTRYLNEIRKGRDNNDLVPTVARMMRRVTKGAGLLAEAGRRDLMVETRIVLDETRLPLPLQREDDRARAPAATRTRLRLRGDAFDRLARASEDSPQIDRGSEPVGVVRSRESSSRIRG